jgi:stage IV sporulation protein FB
MLRSGSITIAHVHGIPIRMHWTTPLGALVFTGFSLNPLVWIGFVVVVLVHELGHAACVRFYGHTVTAIEVNGLGGHCEWAGDPTAKEDAVVASGGVVAQGLLFLGTILVLTMIGPTPWFLGGIERAFTSINLGMIAMNLLPIPPLDGSRAWTLIPLVAAERGWWKPSHGAPSSRPTSRWSRSAEWLQRLAAENERRDAERKRKARAAVEKELKDLDASDEEAPSPLQSEIRKVLDRILGKR